MRPYSIRPRNGSFFFRSRRRSKGLAPPFLFFQVLASNYLDIVQCLTQLRSSMNACTCLHLSSSVRTSSIMSFRQRVDLIPLLPSPQHHSPSPSHSDASLSRRHAPPAQSLHAPPANTSRKGRQCLLLKPPAAHPALPAQRPFFSQVRGIGILMQDVKEDLSRDSAAAAAAPDIVEMLKSRPAPVAAPCATDAQASTAPAQPQGPGAALAALRPKSSMATEEIRMSQVDMDIFDSLPPDIQRGVRGW